MEILIFIFIIIAIVNASSKDMKKKNMQNNGGVVYERSNQRNTTQTGTYSRSTLNNERFRQTARVNIEKAARRASAVANKALNEIFMDEGVASPETEDMSAKERIMARRMEERNTTILQRAKGNANEQKEDVTLNTMEAEHNHSERVSAAVHNHPEDIIPENMLGSIEDLMIKGYDGNLCFERDFVGEAMDMISRFTVPSDVPDFSNKEAS